MIKRTSTKWVQIEPPSMVTRIHYPIFAGKWLVKLDRVSFGTIRGRIIKQILQLIGVWQEYRAFNTFDMMDAFLEQHKLEGGDGSQA